jgi:hypothetical protein
VDGAGISLPVVSGEFRDRFHLDRRTTGGIPSFTEREIMPGEKNRRRFSAVACSLEAGGPCREEVSE